jgi:K+-sensing histidine kinase KdpD
MHTSQGKSSLKTEIQVLKKQINILYQIGKSLNSTLDLESLFWNIYKLVREAIPTNAFYIASWNNDTNFLDMLFIINDNKQCPRVLQPVGNGIVSQAISKRETIFVNRTEGEKDSATPDLLNTTGDNDKTSKSILVSPILVRDQVVGVMSTQSYGVDMYSDEDAKLLSLVATQAGVALENSQLYQRIKLERDKLDAILTHLGEGVNIIDVNFSIQFANKWITDRYGQNLRGKKCYEVFFGYQKPCNGCPMNGENKNKAASLEVQTEEGKVFLLTITPFNKWENGETGTVLEIIRDITEKKIYEEETIQKEKLKSVIELAGAVGHELNQPLTGITGYCALIKEELHEEHPLYNDINEIEKQAARLEKLVNKFQNIARLENQGYTRDNKILDLRKSSAIREY